MSSPSKGVREPEPSEVTTGARELIVVVEAKAAGQVSPTGRFVVSPFLQSVGDLLRGTGAVLTPLFGQARVGMAAPPGARGIRGPATPDLSRFFRVGAADQQLDAIAKTLRERPEVRGAYVKPRARPAVLSLLNAMVPSAPRPARKTPDFTTRQKYLDPAPVGVDARYAWTVPGGTGKDVRIVDVEGEWRFTHEDLLQNKGGVVGGVPPNDLEWRNHGTAVIAQFGADDNKIGTRGICPDAEVSAISIFPIDTMGSSVAIRQAAQRLRAGDILLIELHRPGPRYGFVDRDDQAGYIPVEWWPDDSAVIQFATSRGIVVVEAGGNGGEDLDDALYNTPQEGFPDDWKNPFQRSNRDCGAIVVGAGAPPPGTHGRDWGPDRSRLDFSNYGSMVDVQGWGREVTTCGYGDLQGGVEDVWYTDQFSGTSSASPIIVGAIGCMQGMQRASSLAPHTPAQVRNLLRTTGSPQVNGPGRPATQRIGSRPDLRQLLGTASAASPRVSKGKPALSKPASKPKARKRK
jgi:hypothetical protein